MVNTLDTMYTMYITNWAWRRIGLLFTTYLIYESSTVLRIEMFVFPYLWTQTKQYNRLVLWKWPLIYIYKCLKRKFPISTCRFWCPMFWLFIIIINPYVWFSNKLFKRLEHHFQNPREYVEKPKLEKRKHARSYTVHIHTHKIYIQILLSYIIILLYIYIIQL